MGTDMYLDRDYFHGITLQQKNEQIAALKKELDITKTRLQLRELHLTNEEVIDNYSEIVYDQKQLIERMEKLLAEIVEYNPLKEDCIQLDNLKLFDSRIHQAESLLEELGA